jgi:hypothetical protein
VDPADATDLSMTQVQGVFAQLDNAHRTKTMRDARYAKAKRGDLVVDYQSAGSSAPTAHWTSTPRFVTPSNEVRRVFWETGSFRKTVRALAAAERTLPSRVDGQLSGSPRRSIGYATFSCTKRTRDSTSSGVPRWRSTRRKGAACSGRLLRTLDRARQPSSAYMTAEEQERIRQRAAQNDFTSRHRQVWSRATAGLAGMRSVYESSYCCRSRAGAP